MKIKKALKKLDKAESLLSSIIDEYDTAEAPVLKEALAAAKESVVRAKETVNHTSAAEPKTARKSAGKASADAPHATESRERRKVRVAAAAGQ